MDLDIWTTSIFCPGADSDVIPRNEATVFTAPHSSCVDSPPVGRTYRNTVPQLTSQRFTWRVEMWRPDFKKLICSWVRPSLQWEINSEGGSSRLLKNDKGTRKIVRRMALTRVVTISMAVFCCIYASPLGFCTILPLMHFKKIIVAMIAEGSWFWMHHSDQTHQHSCTTTSRLKVNQETGNFILNMGNMKENLSIYAKRATVPTSLQWSILSFSCQPYSTDLWIYHLVIDWVVCWRPLLIFHLTSHQIGVYHLWQTTWLCEGMPCEMKAVALLYIS